MDSDAGADSPTSSSASTASTAELPCDIFIPRFIITVKESVNEASGSRYSVKTIRKSDGAEFSVKRGFEDFESLHNKLMAEICTNGIIMPPLPDHISESASSSSSARDSGVFRDCSHLEKYLALVAAHSKLGKSECLVVFLTNPESFSVMKTASVGILGKLVMAATDSRKYNHPDIDDYFQRTRDVANDYNIRVHVAAKSFSNQQASQRSILMPDALPDASSSLTSSLQDGSSLASYYRHHKNYIDSHCLDTDAANSEDTLGFQLDHQRQYSLSVKDMLNRRTLMLIDYEDASKAFEKAKPLKRAAAEDAKMTAEKSLGECSDIARIELKDYHTQRVASMKESLCSFSEAKLKSAKDFHALLGKSLEYFKQLEQD